MTVHDEVTELFADWSDETIRIYSRDGGQTALVMLGADLIGTSPANGGNAGSSIVNRILTRPNLAAITEDGEEPNWKYLLNGGKVLVCRATDHRPSWYWLFGEGIPMFITIAEISSVTGLAINTVRERLRRWTSNGLIAPEPGYGERGVRSYSLERVRELIGGRGPGNRTTGERRSEAAKRGHETRRRNQDLHNMA